MAWIGRIEIEGQDYGTMQIPAEFRHGTDYPPSSFAYFCSTCGKVWARVTIQGRPYLPWSIRCQSCARGAYILEVGGSLWLSWERSFNAALPTKVLQREFELHVAQVIEPPPGAGRD